MPLNFPWCRLSMEEPASPLSSSNSLVLNSLLPPQTDKGTSCENTSFKTWHSTQSMHSSKHAKTQSMHTREQPAPNDSTRCHDFSFSKPPAWKPYDVISETNEYQLDEWGYGDMLFILKKLNKSALFCTISLPKYWSGRGMLPFARNSHASTLREFLYKYTR